LKKPITLFLISSAFLAIIFSFVSLSKYDLTEFLSKNEPVNANVLIVEGWIPDYAVQSAAEEAEKGSYDVVITTGIQSADLEYLTVGMNGYLIFYPDLSGETEQNAEYHSVEVVAKSKIGGKYCAHFTLYVNDENISEFNADNVSRNYGCEWFGSLNNIDSVMIYFDNDMLDENGDVNLYVKELIIDGKIVVPYQFNSAYDIGILDGKERIINNYKTVAELARNKMIKYGTDPSKIFAFPAYRKGINRTLSSVIACRKGLKSLTVNVTGINIITLGIHSRRTWFTYKTILNSPAKIGVLSIAEKDIDKEKENGRKKNIKELFNLIYYSALLIPFYLT